MEFKYPIHDLFQEEISCVGGSLIPDGYQADDRESYAECREKVSMILDQIGQLSGIAQGLQVPVTTSDRLKNSEHRVYLMNDFQAGENGQVVGLLKVGRKKLYVFDQSGSHHELQPLCVLDFYIHESKQRLGCGKHLYEHMLQAEGVEPGHLAFDRPSEKLTSFLAKHYDLTTIIPQSNNFVVYDRFFDSRSDNQNGRSEYSKKVDYGYSRPAAGCGTVRRDSQVQTSRRATVVNRPHSSISKIMDAKDCPMFERQDRGDDVSGRTSPAGSIASSCSASLESADTPHRDMKFQHQRLW